MAGKDLPRLDWKNIFTVGAPEEFKPGDEDALEKYFSRFLPPQKTYVQAVITNWLVDFQASSRAHWKAILDLNGGWFMVMRVV